jgi:NAD(P)H-quinone oxidoreductase subunit 4
MLSALIWVPIVSAALIGFWPGAIASKSARRVTLIVAGGIFVLSVLLLLQFNPSEANQQFQENLRWIDALGLTYSLGVDGLSLPLLVLNSLLTGIAVYSSDETLERPRLYYSLILLLNAGVAVHLAQDLLLFFLFYELELIPLYLLIAIWGGQRRGYAATKFLLYTAVSGALILVAFLGVVFLSGANSFAYVDTVAPRVFTATNPAITAPRSDFGCFGIKIPLVPFIPGCQMPTLRHQHQFLYCSRVCC